MKLEWLGEYRELVEKVIKFGNAYAARQQKVQDIGAPVPFSAAELQTMEYILENEDKHQNMAEIAARLGMSPSTFSKNVRKMLDKGLLEKYHAAGNRKNIIVRVSPQGREVYEFYTRYAMDHFFSELFARLDQIPREYVDSFAQIMELWAGEAKRLPSGKPVTLIKIE